MKLKLFVVISKVCEPFRVSILVHIRILIIRFVKKDKQLLCRLSIERKIQFVNLSQEFPRSFPVKKLQILWSTNQKYYYARISYNVNQKKSAFEMNDMSIRRNM